MIVNTIGRKLAKLQDDREKCGVPFHGPWWKGHGRFVLPSEHPGKNPSADLFLGNRELHYFIYEKPPGLGGTTVD